MTENLPFPFNFYLRIIQRDHLHFGYWPDEPGELSLEQAQENLSELVYKGIPRKPCRILDVGCGLGVSAYELARKGHLVTALAPSKELIAYAEDKYLHDSLTFVNSDFFEFARNQAKSDSFDVVLFQESFQYLRTLDDVFRLCWRLLGDKGRVVLCDEVLLDLSISGQTAVHPRKEIIVSVFENGFYIKKMLDMGRSVSPTCDWVIDRLESIKDSIDRHERKNGFDKLVAGWRSQKEWYENNQFSYVLMNLISDDIKLKPYGEGDEKAILPLFNEIFHVNRSMEHWVWKFVDNPFGSKMIALAVDSQDNIAAHYSAYPVRFYSVFPGYDSFLSCQAGDTMTTPAYRNVGLGPTSVLSRTAVYFYEKFCRDNVPFMYGFNTGNIRKFGERYLGYIYNEQVPYYVLDRHSAEKGKWHFLKKRLLQRMKVRRIEGPEKVFDVFYGRVKKHFRLMVTRDLKYLKWRYFDAPDTDYLVYGLFSKGVMTGWAVFKRLDDRLIMGDFLLDREDIESSGLIFECVFKVNPGVRSISAWCSPSPSWCSLALSKAGFERQEEPNRLAPGFRVFDDFFFAETFQENFYYTMGDSDLF